MREIKIAPGKAYEVAYGLAREFVSANRRNWREAHDYWVSYGKMRKLEKSIRDAGKDPSRSLRFVREEASVTSRPVDLLLEMWMEAEEMDRTGDHNLKGLIVNEIRNFQPYDFGQTDPWNPPAKTHSIGEDGKPLCQGESE